MRSLGVVPEQPVDQSLVEASKVVPQSCPMVLNEVLRERPVEAFDVAVHARAAGIRVIPRDGEPSARVIEVPGKLGAVVGLQGRYRSK